MLAGPLMVYGLGTTELLVILGIGILIFGAGRIPEIARALGKSVKEFKKAGKEIAQDVTESTKDDSKNA